MFLPAAVDHNAQRIMDKAGTLGLAGHTFVVQGDLLKIACDEILVPTDASGIVTPAWKSLGTPSLPDRWGDDGVRVTAVADRLGHHIRWVNTGGVPSSAEARIGWLRDGVRSGLQAAAADLGNRRPLYKRAKHLIGLPLFGTGAGGFDGIRGAAINGLLSVCDEVARDRDVDVVSTSRHRSDYAALQSQRRDSAQFDSLSRNLLSKADDLGASDGRQRGRVLPGCRDQRPRRASVVEGVDQSAC